MSKTVKVANPIYDVVFKYLLEDTRVARLLLSALLELEVIEVELKPQEYSSGIEAKKNFTVYRIDFKARIKDSEGKEQIVLIELQKAKLATDVMRFRRYLGMQYAHQDNIVEIEIKEKDKDGKEKVRIKKQALPIITIYFLGYPLDNFNDRAVIRVSRRFIDQSTKEEIQEKDYFIESLTHDSIVIQIAAIKHKERRNELEKILSVFEQGTIHEVDINEDDYPEEYQMIIRRLKEALADPEVRETMIVEDEILSELAEKERQVAEAEKKAEQAEKKAEQAEKKAEQAEKKAEQAEKEVKETERKAIDAKKNEQEVKIKLAKKMLKYSESIEEIMKETGLSRADIEFL